MDTQQIPKEMLKLWKSGFETYVKTLESMQGQADKMFDLMLQQSDSLRDELKKMLKDWTANAKELQKSYLQAMQESVKKFEDLFGEK